MITPHLVPRDGEHSLFTSSSIASRPQLSWPAGTKVALLLVLHLECMDFEAPPETVADPRWRERIWPDPRLQSWYEYGNRVAIFRILDVLDRLNLKATVAANALACERYPSLIERLDARGFEIAAHGAAANRMISDRLDEAAERRLIGETLARIEAATGSRPQGWIAQDFGESPRTPKLLSEAGLRYLADWPNDDEPYAMEGAGGIVSLPAAYELDDLRLFIERRLQAWRYPPLISDAFATLWAEGETRPRVLPLSIHPWVFGAPHRLRYLAEALTVLARQDGLWNTPALDLAASAQSRT